MGEDVPIVHCTDFSLLSHTWTHQPTCLTESTVWVTLDASNWAKTRTERRAGRRQRHGKQMRGAKVWTDHWRKWGWRERFIIIPPKPYAFRGRGDVVKEWRRRNSLRDGENRGKDTKVTKRMVEKKRAEAVIYEAGFSSALWYYQLLFVKHKNAFK